MDVALRGRGMGECTLLLTEKVSTQIPHTSGLT